MKKDSKIFVANSDKFIGKAIAKALREKGYDNLLLAREKDLNLLNQSLVNGFFEREKPEYIFLTPLLSGGIMANSKYPADFIYKNTVSQINVIHAAYKNKVKKMLFLGSACAYPKFCHQPIKEEYFLTGAIESTNEPFAAAMINGMKMCQAYNSQHKTNFIFAIPTNVYGIGDDFSDAGHVIAGLIKKFFEAKKENKKEVMVWGTGNPKREFMYIDDFSEACIFLMNRYSKNELINIAGGKEVSIRELAEIIKKVSGFKGNIVFEKDKPDGMLRRLLDGKKMKKLGWKPKISFKEGLKKTYEWYSKNN